MTAAENQSDDRRWMEVALGLARRGLGRTAPNPSVGAVLVSDGRIVGRGWTAPGGRPHAEPQALAEAGPEARGATLYVTLEPCSHHGVTPPCAGALIEAFVSRVVAAMPDPDRRVAGRGFALLEQAGIAVVRGVCEAEARTLNAGHVSRVTRGRPHVRLKVAVSRDGKVGVAGGPPVAISGEASRARVHLMRAEADAIMVGAGTVRADDPALTCRLPGMAARSPIRIVLDGGLTVSTTSRLVATARETPVWAVCATGADAGREAALRAAGVEVIRAETGADGRLQLRPVLVRLAARGITRLMVEGGPTLSAAMLAAGLIDEATVVTGPGEIGEGGLDAGLDGLCGMEEVARKAVGDDLWTVYQRS